MFGFLFKVVLLAAVVAAIGGVIYLRRGGLPNPRSFADEVIHAARTADASIVWRNLSSSLDSLVTHPQPNSPVVLGIEVSNDSLDTVVNALQNLPPEQADQIRSALCSPISSPSGQ